MTRIYLPTECSWHFSLAGDKTNYKEQQRSSGVTGLSVRFLQVVRGLYIIYIFWGCTSQSTLVFGLMVCRGVSRPYFNMSCKGLQQWEESKGHLLQDAKEDISVRSTCQSGQSTTSGFPNISSFQTDLLMFQQLQVHGNIWQCSKRGVWSGS